MNELDAVLYDAFRTRLMRRMGDAMLHDLRSPVQGLGFCLDVMQKSVATLAEGDPARTAIDKAVAMGRRELARMERVSRELLADAGIVKDRVARFDLIQLTREVAHHFVTEAAMRGVAFSVRAPDEPVYVSGPRSEIGRAILVCTVDALDSVPDGGRVEVAVCAEGGRASVEVSCEREAPSDHGADEYSLASMGLRFARASIEAGGGEFISGNGITGIRLAVTSA